MHSDSGNRVKKSEHEQQQREANESITEKLTTAADPDLQIRGGPSHPDPDIRRGPGLQKSFFSSSGLKLLGGRGWSSPLGPSLGSATGLLLAF